MTTIALIGAAGAMGTRAYGALHDDQDYHILCVEQGAGEETLRSRGIRSLSWEDAVPEADIALMTVPDALVGKVSAQIVPHLKSKAMLMCLDPAAPYAEELPDRKDITYFVTHPAHPPIFNDEVDPEARRDYFGSGVAKQAIVSALVQGPEEDYAKGESIASKMFRPILRSHRVTLEQMAMLEPALSETVGATCITVMREAMDEAVRLGVPFEAARDFMLGHITIELAILFDEIDWEFSAGAKVAIQEAKKDIFKSDWKKVFEAEHLMQSVKRIVDG